MPLELATTPGAPVEFSDYIAHVRGEVDPLDTDSVLASAPMLRRLAENRDFLAQIMNEELKNASRFQAENGYSAQSLVLHKSETWAVRVNLWETADRLKDPRAFSYGLPHDHNFDFLTVGYWGDGYVSENWEYDGAHIDGLPDEKVALSYAGRRTLAPGDILFYRKACDIHTVYPPSRFSVSVNMTLRGSGYLQPQYIFDTDHQRVQAPIYLQGSARMVLEAIRSLGNEDSKDIVDWISTGHPCRHTRAAAYATLYELEPDDRAAQGRRAGADGSGYVRAMAKRMYAG
ncbi:MAG: hypothetical protein V3V08_04690 [Nannocystaceae bacterium]